MFATLRTLIAGANARAEEGVRQRFAVDLIDQKIREAQAGLRAAKGGLAALIQRQRAETRAIETLEGRIADLVSRAREALEGDREDMARGAAEAIAEMENELALRRETRNRLDARVIRLRSSVEAANRRIVDLKQKAVAARAVHREQALQSRLGAATGEDPMAEAEELIRSVTDRDDPFETSQILEEIDRNLDHRDVADRMSAEGFGPATKSTAADVLARLRGGTGERPAQD